MVEARQAARQRGAKVVFTNGCFDVLHMGHVLYLREARALGDLLFVGVNSDDSARRLKGPDRPYNRESDRAGIVAALRDVSAAVIFSEDTAADVIRAVEPDVYVKGGDYSADPRSSGYPVEGKVVVAQGGVVRILPLAPGYATTTIVERIRRGGA